jgi:hypothetical protein
MGNSFVEHLKDNRETLHSLRRAGTNAQNHPNTTVDVRSPLGKASKVQARCQLDHLGTLDHQTRRASLYLEPLRLEQRQRLRLRRCL